MADELKAIETLVNDPANRRKHPARNVDMIRASLQQLGAARSIVVDEDDVILAGNGVTAAAIAAGLTSVRVIESSGDELIAVRRRGLTPEQKRALALFDNRTAELAEWDTDALRGDVDAGLDLQPFWSDDEEAELLARPGTVGETDPDDIPAARSTTVQRGDVFALGPHRVICGDSTNPEDVARVLDGVPVDAVVTDPPYCSGGFQEAGRKAGSIGTRGDEMIANDTLSTRGYMALIRTVLDRVGAGVVYVFTDWRMWVNLFDVVESSGYGVRAMIVWDKQTPGMGRGWRSQHELILCGSRVSLPFDPTKAQGNVIQCTRTGNVNHPTEKPVDLVAKVLAVSDTAQRVGDPFLGSGTTLIACEQVGRACVGLDLDPVWCQVTIDRWEAFTGQRAVKVGGV